MVAAGAYLLARLQPALAATTWFGPLLMTIGTLTALVGGGVALLQPQAKKLLAASTSAHYGLMFVAIGAGFPAWRLLHLVAHGCFKALLFLCAGVAIERQRQPRAEPDAPRPRAAVGSGGGGHRQCGAGGTATAGRRLDQGSDRRRGRQRRRRLGPRR